jgi:poly-gamma-glutamate capsule biosynthesis protein CapA/YwtB (metallophosphatase superfamily)
MSHGNRSMNNLNIRFNHLLTILIAFSFLTACVDTQAEIIHIETTFPPSPAAETEPTSAPSPQPTAIQVNPTATKQKPSNASITLMAVGDIMLSRTIGDMIETEGIESPFEFTAETLSAADITLGNLECSISIQGEPEDKTYAFRAPLAAVESLSYSGFDLVSLANNHILDYGPDALEETLQTLHDQSILSVGAGMDADQAYQPVIMEINGLKIAFLAFADVPTIDYDYTTWEADINKPGIAWAHPDNIIQGVQAAKAQADIVVVLFHNGYEIAQKVSAEQQEVAHLAIDNGAALVIGSHPHVLQRIEAYNEGLIVYSMGNFVFDNFLFPPNYSAILSVTLNAQGVLSYELIDVIVQLNGVPQIMEYDLGD